MLAGKLAPRYQQAAGAQKMLLLDRAVKLTGHAREYVIRLLNHAPKVPPASYAHVHPFMVRQCKLLCSLDFSVPICFTKAERESPCDSSRG